MLSIDRSRATACRKSLAQTRTSCRELCLSCRFCSGSVTQQPSTKGRGRMDSMDAYKSPVQSGTTDRTCATRHQNALVAMPSRKKAAAGCEGSRSIEGLRSRFVPGFSLHDTEWLFQFAVSSVGRLEARRHTSHASMQTSQQPQATSVSWPSSRSSPRKYAPRVLKAGFGTETPRVKTPCREAAGHTA